jgi:blocked-early-in-transport protein 1
MSARRTAARPPGTTANHHEAVHDTEAENDAILKALLADVRTLKGHAKGIDAEVKQHNEILDGLMKNMIAAKDGVSKTVRKLDTVTGSAAASHMWLLFLVAFVVFFFIYVMLRRG